jgi:hypothetical protein
MKGSYVDGTFVPKDKSKYDRAVHFLIPEHLSDAAHWGHLGWMFCEFTKSLTVSIR